MTDMVERCARAIANGLGDEFDHAFICKSEWNAARGEKGGRYRDINEPMQADYLDAARAAIEAMREPTPLMLEVADYAMPGVTKESSEANQQKAWQLWRKMIDAALSQSGSS